MNKDGLEFVHEIFNHLFLSQVYANSGSGRSIAAGPTQALTKLSSKRFFLAYLVLKVPKWTP